MPQDPMLLDAILVEPGTTTYGTRRIDRASADGSLQFADPYVTVLLSALVGVRNITGLFLVGRAGDGAPYTTIQDAIDAIPDTSSPSAPSLVVVGPGEYSENLVINMDGVVIVGLGRPKITASVGPTVSIEDTALSTPESVILRDLVIENTGVGEECILISGAGTFASGTATAVTAPLVAGDSLTIGGTALTGIVGTRVAGSDNFSVDPTSAALMAIELAAAINDPLNSFAATVSAAALAAVVTITAVAAGVGGNAITLAVSTTPGGGITVSGATLSGGSSAGSTVAEVAVQILDCDLIASGAGGLQISADTVNNIRVEGGTWRGSASDSKALITQCASFIVNGVEWVNDLEVSYDDGNDQPFTTTSEYRVSHCARVGDILSSQVGVGTFLMSHCDGTGSITAGGGMGFFLSHCRVGAVSLDGTVAARFIETVRGALTLAGGTPTFEESREVGSAAYAGVPLVVSFTVAQPDTNYEVFLSPLVTSDTYAVTAKTTASFTIDAAAATAATVGYAVMRQM